MKYRYTYEGKVFLNDSLALSMWKTEVEASNGKDANFKVRDNFRKQYDLSKNSRVRLYGKFKKLEAVM